MIDFFYPSDSAIILIDSKRFNNGLIWLLLSNSPTPSTKASFRSRGRRLFEVQDYSPNQAAIKCLYTFINAYRNSSHIRTALRFCQSLIGEVAMLKNRSTREKPTELRTTLHCCHRHDRISKSFNFKPTAAMLSRYAQSPAVFSLIRFWMCLLTVKLYSAFWYGRSWSKTKIGGRKTYHPASQ
jgi:hypothetical protein